MCITPCVCGSNLVRLEYPGGDTIFSQSNKTFPNLSREGSTYRQIKEPPTSAALIRKVDRWNGIWWYGGWVFDQWRSLHFTHSQPRFFIFYQILVSATLTHDPGPLKRFNLYFPRLFTSTEVDHHFSGDAIASSYGHSAAVEQDPPAAATSSVESPHRLDEPSRKRSRRDDRSVEFVHSTDDITDMSSAGVGVFSTPSGLKVCMLSLYYQS